MSYSDSAKNPITSDVSAGIPYSGRGTKPKALTGQTSRPFPSPTPNPPPPTPTLTSTPTPRSSTGFTPGPPTPTLTPRSTIGSTPNPSSSTPTSEHAFALIITMLMIEVVILIVITIIAYKNWKNKRQKKDTSDGVGKKLLKNKRQKKDTSHGVGKMLLMSSTTSGGDSKIEVASTERFIEEFSKIEVASTERLIEEFSKDKPMRFSPSDLIAFTRNYTHQLGFGGFGEVYKGEMYNGVLVAVKVLKKISDSNVSEQFLAELCSIGRTYHINLVKLYGYCFENDMKALIYEYMENGSLESCLADRCKLNWEKLYQIAIGTARGIRYLHEECHKMIVHYNIKPGNVLLSQNFSPKLADFGMAELFDRESTLQTDTQGRGTLDFIAPELSQPISVTHKCDVYSYGMLLFQIVGSRRIMEGKQTDSLQTSAYWVHEKAGEEEFVSIMSSCGIEEKDRLKAKRICEVALTCVQLQPKKRPSMSTILMMLEGEKDICVRESLYSNVASTSGGDSKIEIASTERFIEEFSKDKPMRFSPSDLIAFTHNYTHKLGSGGFGEVYKGETYNGVQVAVKVLKKISDSNVSEQFLAELCSIGQTYHINLVKLYGFCFENDMKALVYEYMENGSLESCLADRCKLNWEKLYRIAIGTARGIRYLHEECHKMIIHYDIKPGNVLLCRNFTPKVADFGMAELWDRESTLLTVTQERGTPGFIAPELSQPLSVTYKCDVYSYGMLLFQIIGSKRIIEGKQIDSLQTSTNWVREKAGQGEFASIISSCGIEEKDRPKAKRMCEVALMCVQRHPENRPLMSTVLMMLEGKKNTGVQGSLHSNVVSGELEGSKSDVISDKPYRNAASDELCGSKSKLLINVTSDEPYNNVASVELGGSKSEPIINVTSDESYSNVSSSELGGSKPDSYNNVAPGELGGSKSDSKADVAVGSPQAKSDMINCYMYTVREDDILP